MVRTSQQEGGILGRHLNHRLSKLLHQMIMLDHILELIR